MRSVLVVTGGSLDMEFASEYLKKNRFDKVIAVDGGLEACKKLGIMPDHVVGDFDTVAGSVVEEYEQIPYIVWHKHRPEKNETDTELARDVALELPDVGSIVFLGALGGRMDHMLSNLQTLFKCMTFGKAAFIVDERNRISMVDEKKQFKKHDLWGKYVSFVPFTETVRGITLTGFKYPLEKRDIRLGEETGLCISNELAEDTAEIELEDGVLVCVESRD